MDDEQVVAELIERIIQDARLPGRAARDELRLELASHFDAAGSTPDELRNAVHRFGSQDALTTAFRRVYRWDYIALYLVKIAASIIASVAVALVIQVLVNLRLELRAEAWRLAPEFSKAAVISVGVVLGLVAAWETSRQPFDSRRAVVAVSAYVAVWAAVAFLGRGGAGTFGPATLLVALGYVSSRLGLRPGSLFLTFSVFATAIYGIHQAVSISVGPARALATSAVLLAVWASTVAILSRFDHIFGHLFGLSEEGTI